MLAKSGFMSGRPRYTVPSMSVMIKFFMPAATRSLAIAMPAAPAPENTTLTVLSVLPTTFNALSNPCQNNDGRAVLVVVEDRNIQFFLQFALDFKAARSGDVLQIDPAEAARD